MSNLPELLRLRLLLVAIVVFGDLGTVRAGAQAIDGPGFERGSICPRNSLQLPDEIWSAVADKTGFADRPVGFSDAQMRGFPAHRFRLRAVENCFRDARSVPRYAGQLTESLLEKPDEPAHLVFTCWHQLDAKAGRDWRVPESNEWGVPWLPAGGSPIDALEAILTYDYAPRCYKWPTSTLSAADREALATAGEAVQRLVVRVFVAAAEARPYLVAAHNLTVLNRASAIGFGPSREELFAFLAAPFRDDSNNDTGAVSARSAYQALAELDTSYAAFGAVVFFRHLEAALREFEAASHTTRSATFSPIVLSTALGPIHIAGAGADRHPGGAFLVLDMGGDDHYDGLIAAPVSLGTPISVVIDLGGNDTYDGRAHSANVGCGLLGVGALLDFSGNDTYRATECGLGCGFYGTGILMDSTGDDEYEVEKGWGQGAAYAGVGVLADLEGDDEYRCATMSQGYGGTLGVGLLLDVAGNDTYYAADDGNPSAVWGGKTVSLTLGARLWPAGGFRRRPQPCGRHRHPARRRGQRPLSHQHLQPGQRLLVGVWHLRRSWRK